MGSNRGKRDRRVCLAVSQKEFEMLQYAQSMLSREKGREISMNMVFLILANRFIKAKEKGDGADEYPSEGLQDTRVGLISIRNELNELIDRLRVENE